MYIYISMEIYIKVSQEESMNNKEKIGTTELTFLVMSICLALFPAFGTATIINYGKNTAIISVIIGSIIGLIPLFMILYIAKFTTDKNILEVNDEKFKMFGKFINILYFIGIVFIGFCISWQVINFTISHLLTRTSYYVVGIILFSVMSYAIVKGNEVILRSNLILTMLGSVLFIFIFIFLIPKIKIDNFLPIINVKKASIISTALIVPTFMVYPLISILCIKKDEVNDKSKYNKSIIKGYTLVVIIIIIFMIFILGIYGSNMASLFTFPEYYIFKKIRAFDFISRIENIAAALIYISFFGNMASLMNFAKTCVKKALNLKNVRVINLATYILSILVPILSIIFFKKYQHLQILKYYPIISSILLIALIINFILLFIAKKKNNLYP